MIADYKQMVAEVEDEASRWEEMDPQVLRAVVDGDISKAQELYSNGTGASSIKARMLINKIQDNVKARYPNILRIQAMEKIKDIWPYGSNYIVAFQKRDDGDYNIGFVWVTADINGIYTFHRDFMWHEKDTFQLLINKGTMILKRAREIIEIKDMKVLDVNFNPEDEEYKRCKAIYDDMLLHKDLQLYHYKDIEKFESGELSKESLLIAGTKYRFKFSRKSSDVPYWTHIKVDNFNIAQWFLDAYFEYYRIKFLNGGEINFWESKAYYESLAESNGFSGNNPAEFIERYQLKLLECKDTDMYAITPFEAIGLSTDRGFWEGDSRWDRNIQNMNSIYCTFDKFIKDGNIAARPTVLRIFDDGSGYVVSFDFDLLRDKNLNTEAKESLSDVIVGSQIENLGFELKLAKFKMFVSKEDKARITYHIGTKMEIYDEL